MHFDFGSVLGLLALVGTLYNTYGHGRNGGAIQGILAGLGAVSTAQAQTAQNLHNIALDMPAAPVTLINPPRPGV